MTTKPKTTRTLYYMLGNAKSPRQKSIRHALGERSPIRRRFIQRLGLTSTQEAIHYSHAHIRAAIDGPGKDAAIYCDTSLFDDATDAALWTTLLQVPGRVTITEDVRDELSPWIETHPNHIAARAVQNGEPWVRIVRAGGFNKALQSALVYYVNLLARRRLPLIIEHEMFADKHGREPTEGEFRKLRIDLSQLLGPRGYMLAKKAFEERHAQPRFTDESLVCLPFVTAIVTGRETIILTKDEDVFEQFFKLQWLLDTHYRGMLLAKYFQAHPSSFAQHAFPRTDDPRVDQLFTPEKRVLIERSPELLEQILPRKCDPVMIYCWVLGERLSQFAFCAERGLEDVLLMKARTGGLNTDRLNGQNCHIWLSPLLIPLRLRTCAAIVEDNRETPKPDTNVRSPLFDLLQSLHCGEGTTGVSVR